MICLYGLCNFFLCFAVFMFHRALAMSEYQLMYVCMYIVVSKPQRTTLLLPAKIDRNIVYIHICTVSFIINRPPGRVAAFFVFIANTIRDRN